MLDAVLLVVLVITATIMLRKRNPPPTPAPARPTLRLQARVFTAVVSMAAVAVLAFKMFK